MNNILQYCYVSVAHLIIIIEKLELINSVRFILFVPGEQPLQVARCTKIINADSDDPKYIINVKQFAKFVVDLSDQVAPTDIEEGMRVGLVSKHLCKYYS